MVALPPKNDTDGCETRVLLAECRTPSFGGYSLADAKKCMQLMDKVLWNRLRNPAPFGAAGATKLSDVVRARGQFAGFEGYPDYDKSIVNRIQAMINIANSTKDKRSQAFADHIATAIAVAQDPSIVEPSAGILASWRTAGSASPGANFKLHDTLLGIDFYFIS